MRSRWARSALLAAMVSVAAPAGAQDSPRDVAEAFFKAVAEERWRDAAHHLDVAALDRFRRERIAAARLPQPRPRPVTAEELMRLAPDMPREVAEYQARKSNEATREFSWVEYEFADVADVEALAALSPQESAARWLQARDLRWRARRDAERQREQGCAVPPRRDSALPPPSHHIIGQVIADSVTAYVLHDDRRWQRPEPDVDAAVHDQGPSILALRRRDGRWRVLPRVGMFHGMAMMVATECVSGIVLPR